MRRRGRRRLVVVGVALILCAGCRTVPVSERSGSNSLPLPPPVPQDGTNFSDYEPKHPYLPTGPGVAERSVYTDHDLKGYAVEVREVLVSPAQPDAELVIAGAAVVEVRQGSGTATIGEQGGQKIKLSPGTLFTVDQGARLWLTAVGEPLALRTWIVSVGGKS